MGFLDKVTGNIRQTASKAREGVEELQTKRELGQAYGELGRKAFDLVDAGKIQAPELELDIERIRKLKTDLEAERSQEPKRPAAAGVNDWEGEGGATR